MNELIQQWQFLPLFDRIVWVVSLGSTFMLVIYYLLEFAGHNADLEIPEHDDAFSILSIRSLLAFGTFMGWTFILVRRSGSSLAEALVAGVIAGAISVWLVWKLLRILMRMQSDGATLDIRQLVGKEAVVYLVVPANEQRTGKIHLTIQDAFREFDVVTNAPHDLPTGSQVLVSEIRADGVPMVIPL